MVKATFRRQITVIGVLGTLAIGCSNDGSSDAGIATDPDGSSAGSSGQSGAAGVTPTPAAGSSATPTGTAGGGSPTAGMGSTPVPPASGGAPAAGSGGSTAAGNGAAGGSAGAAGQTAPATEKFSFFVTSWAAMQRLSKSENGFGGDLRYGAADGLAGADKICTEIAETSMPGSGAKGWRAFLSVTKGPDGQPVHAIDRVGEGPWYDRLGRVISMDKTSLAMTRPGGADAMILNDLPNEDGVPNHAPDGMLVDNHDLLTGTNNKGQLFSTDWRFTCHDWTSSNGPDGTPRVGHSWPRMGGGFGGGRPGRGGGAGSGTGFVPPGVTGGSGAFPGGGEFDTANWMSALNEAGCAAGASLVEMGPPNPANPTVGSGGGYGGIYCFALKP